MKKIAKLMTVLAVAAFTFASCEDVPNPFGPVTPPTTDGDDTNTELPYTSVNLNTGWSLEAVSADQPWSMGNSYVQATGYQKWDGAETKTYRAVEAWLVSPAFSTKGYENVKIWFDQTIKYATYTGWEANHKIYVSSNYDESDFSAATWEEVTDFKPEASKFSDWTLYSSGELQLPASMVGQEAIHIAFYFKAPADKSTTWELKNFNIAEGIADNTGEGDEPTPTGEYGTKENPLTVAQAMDIINGLADNGTASPAYVKGKISKVQSFNDKFKSITYYISDDGTDANALQVYSGKGIDGADFAAATDLEKGWTVIVTGELKKYVNSNTGAVTPEINQSSKIISIDKSTGGGGDTPSGEYGTKENPLTVAQAMNIINGLADNGTASPAYVKGKISKVQSFNDKFKSITYYISDDGTDANALQVYSGKGIDGADFAAATDLEKGWTVIVTGELKKYVNSNTGAVTPEINQSSKIVSIDKSTGGGGGDDPAPSGDSYALVTTIAAGKYIIAAPKEGTTYAVAVPLASNKTYGYLSPADATLTDNKISTEAANEFTFTATTGGYTIQDPSGRYLYMSGTYNSFNVSADVPASGHVWAVTFEGNNVKIVNVEMSKTLQYSSQYKSYGAYADITNTLPSLFKK